MTFPLGLIADGEPYVRSVQRQDGSSLRCSCNVIEGAELSLLESSDIVHDTQQALARRQKDFGSVSGIIRFHCLWRTLALQNNRPILAPMAQSGRRDHRQRGQDHRQ